MNIRKGRTNQQLLFNKKNYQTPQIAIIFILIAGLAAAASGCSASPQAGIEVSASYAMAEQAVEKQAVEAAPISVQEDIATLDEMAAPEQAAEQEALLNQAYEALKSEMNQSAPAEVSEENSQTAQPSTTVTEAPQVTESQPAVESAPAEAMPPAEPKVGFLAPDVTLTSLDGGSIRLADLRGKNVLINYWVTWCIPCMDELPILSQLSQVYQDKNVVILTVNGIEQDQMGAVQQLVAEMGLEQPVLLDEHESFWSTYLVQFLPTSFFIDTQGVIRHIMLGSATEDVIRSKLDQLIVNQL